MPFLVFVGILVVLIALLIGAQKYRDRHRYTGDPNLETDGHAPADHVDVDRTVNPALLAQQQYNVGMGFPGSTGEAQGPNQ